MKRIIRLLFLYWRTMRLSLEAPTERNILLLYIEVVLAGVLAAAGSFNSAYILRAGGSNALVGLLSSLPALIAIFLYLPAAQFLQRRSSYQPWVVGSLWAARSGYLLILLLPFLGQRLLPEATTVIFVAMAVPSVLFSTGWSPLLSDVVPANSRATVLAWRSMLSSATIAPLCYLFGRWLDHGVFPSNYQWMYLVGILGGASSAWLVSRIRMPESANPVALSGAQRVPYWQTLRCTLQENPAFRRIIVNTLCYNLGPWMVGPLYIIFFVRQLGATDSWVGLHSTLAHVGVVAGYAIWRRIIQSIGEDRALLVAILPVCSYPFLVALVPNLTFILIMGFLVNVIHPGYGLGHSIIFLDALPQGQKHNATALYSMIMNIGAFVCPLIGVSVSGALGIAPTLLLGGALQALGASLFYLFPLRGGRPRPHVSRAIPLPRLFGSHRR